MALSATIKESDRPAGPRGSARRSVGWMGLGRGHRARPFEWVVEKAMLLVALSAILMVFLIFAFVGREALPVILGQTSTVHARAARPVADLERMTVGEVQAYLELKPKQYETLDRQILVTLMELKIEAAKEAFHDPDAGANTAAWRFLLWPHRWSDYPEPKFIWQPVSPVPKFNLVPLLVGSLKATLVALLFSVPLALGAALYVSQLGPPRFREILKPAIEMLSGVPSVVLGFFALLVMATWLQKVGGYDSRLNALVAGLAMGFAIIPIVFSLAEDALTSVPRSLTQAALALGASRWQAAWQVALPAALPGVCAAVMLGLGRAIGETMVVLMASGNASILSWSVFDSTRTLTATIAAEMAEAARGGVHYQVLFLLGTLLLVVTLLANLAGEVIVRRLKRRLEAKNP